MQDKWLSRVTFWILAVVPMLLLFPVRTVFGNYWFVSGLMLYIFIYRPILHIFRLLHLKRIEEKDAWKFFIPFYGARYTNTLFFG